MSIQFIDLPKVENPWYENWCGVEIKKNLIDKWIEERSISNIKKGSKWKRDLLKNN